ncbi:MAG: TonB-dependent receptor [Desulfobacterales bacterium]|nr:TonB-dependent receptor [Desulfobacterales bacterium]
MDRIKFRRNKLLIVMLFPFVLSFSNGQASGNQPELPDDLTELSIEELMDVEVTVTARKPQKLSQASAAVFVITGEDIRRSGATNIADILRMVPGLHVARIDSNKWAVSSRGFHSRYSFDLLVLVDGRTAHTSIFSGVYWEVQDTILEDIDRIEIIRGPGASLWGSNAMNGIINIITKSSEDTRGGLAVAGIGTEEKVFGSLRYGDKPSEKIAYRIYTKYFNRDDASHSKGKDTSDAWDMFRTGFRTDMTLSDRDEISMQGDFYNGEKDQMHFIPSLTPPYTERYTEDALMSGNSLLGRWRHVFSDTSDMILQICHDNSEKTESAVLFDENILDFDVQHRFALGSFHDVIWGFRYRFNRNKISSSFAMQFEPLRKTRLFSAFVQDDISVGALRLTLGSKFEYNDYSGFEIQPSARVLWTPRKAHIFWSSVSRSVKSPSRINDDTRYALEIIPPETLKNPTLFPAAITFVGNKNMESEEVVALEMGYRLLVADYMNFDTTVFYNFYNRILSASRGEPYFDTFSDSKYIVVPYYTGAMASAESKGLEIAAGWQLSKKWQLKAAYTYFEMYLDEKMNSDPMVLAHEKWAPPRHQISVLSSADLSRNLEFDLWIRFADQIHDSKVGSYTALDVRLGWKPVEYLELSIAGQNILDSQHPEFNSFLLRSRPAEVERSVYGKITWRF